MLNIFSFQSKIEDIKISDIFYQSNTLINEWLFTTPNPKGSQAFVEKVIEI